MTAVWSFPTRIVFGAGAAGSVGSEAKSLSMSRALVVTDPGVEKTGLHEKVIAALEQADIAPRLYTGVDPNPIESNVEDGAAAFREHEADGVIALGGGSPMDTGKLIAVRARTDRTFEELDDAIGGGEHVPKDLPPVITVPTTAGTGSEVGRAAVVTVRSTNRKTVVFSPHMMPGCAVLDPELTTSMPAKTSAATGFDALTHCMEAYFAKGDHPMADAIALQGIDLVKNHLPQVVVKPDNLAARGAMMKAAMMGAVAFQKGLGACHSLAHPLSSEHGIHHGLANALCLPAVVDFNEKAITERVLHVGILLGGQPELGAAAKAVRDLRMAIGIPSGLRQVGIQEADLEKLADKAFEDACHRENPRPCTRSALLELYRASM